MKEIMSIEFITCHAYCGHTVDGKPCKILVVAATGETVVYSGLKADYEEMYGAHAEAIYDPDTNYGQMVEELDIGVTRGPAGQINLGEQSSKA